MIDQKAFDGVADDLVAAGIRVTYASLREAFLEVSAREVGIEVATSHSPRDLQPPFDDWKLRRRYKPHLAAHDMPEKAEKAVADALDSLRLASDRLPREMLPMGVAAEATEYTGKLDGAVRRLEARMDEMAATNTALLREISALRRKPGVRAIRKGRKAGVFDSTSRHFWNQLMLVFRANIKAEGPKPLEDLLALIDQDAHDLAAAAFEPITETTLREKLSVRVGAKNYFRLEGGMYHLIAPEPRKSASKRPRLRSSQKTGNV